MGTITGYTAERMKQIEDEAITSGAVVGGHLLLTRHDTTQIDAGSVMGPQGLQGVTGATSILPCTNGTRPTGGARFIGLYIYETDTKLTYVWDGTSWIYRGGMIICDSATHPTSPIIGLSIYEVDTQKTLIWNGVRWDPPWNLPWGDVAVPINMNSDSPGFTSIVDIPSSTISWTVIANRRYRFSFSAMVTNSTPGSNVNVIIANASQTEIVHGSGHFSTGDSLAFTGEFPVLAAGPISMHLRGSTGSGTGTLKGSISRTFFGIADVGSYGPPV